MNEFLANEDLPSEAELLGANLASGDWNRGYQVSAFFIVTYEILPYSAEKLVIPKAV